MAGTGGNGGDRGAEQGGGGAAGATPGDLGAGAADGEQEIPRPIVVAEPGTTLVAIDLSEERQVFEGWGTSLCWWANRVGRWSEAGVQRVADVLVNEELGLGYNIFRYNIGGGENPEHSHMQQYMDLEGYQSQDGTFNWNADASQRAVLHALVARGENLILEAFSNSPPYWMTNSGCSAGSADGSANLRSDSYTAFAHYLTEVVKHFRDSEGISFRTLEPLNEPNADWWRSGERQEGCHFSPADQERIIGEVKAQLDEKGLMETVVSAADENSIDDALANLRSFSPETIGAIGQINVHSYHGSQREQLRELATSLGKRLWQSESGPLSVDVADSVEAALFMGGRIMDDLRDMQAEAWIDWQAGDMSQNWASFTLSDQQESYEPLKRFYVQAAFSRFIRPGAQFLGIEQDDVVAALNADGRSLALVIRNGAGPQERSFTFDLTGLPSVGAAVRVFRTSRQDDLAEQPSIPIDGFSFVISTPPESLTSVLVPLGVASLSSG